MSRILATCLPASDVAFGERVRQVVSREGWDLDSPEGLALVQEALRGSYPRATLRTHGVWAGSRRRTIVVEVYRDGPPEAAALGLRWAEAVYDQSGTAAYRLAARILGEGPAAEWAVEQAFRDLRRSVSDDLSVEAGCAAVQAAAVQLADRASAAGHAAHSDDVAPFSVPGPALAGLSVRKGAVRTVLSDRALARLLSSQREALELSVLEDLKVRDIAERMQTTSAVVHGHLNDALLAVGYGDPPSAETTLARWRDMVRTWAALPAHHRVRREQSLATAHAWLDYQVASKTVSPETVVLVTDSERRFVATSGNAAQTFGRPSVAGLRIDDVTAAYARPLVPELWTLFDTNGSMKGEYDCDRPGQAPVRTAFHGVWGRPLPDLQVGYLNPPVAVPVEPTASI